MATYHLVNEPTTREKLETHSLRYPEDLVTAAVVDIYRHLDDLSTQVGSHQHVVDMHQILGG